MPTSDNNTAGSSNATSTQIRMTAPSGQQSTRYLKYGDTIHVHHNQAVSYGSDFELSKDIRTQGIVKCSIRSEGQKTFHDMPKDTMLFMSDEGYLYRSKAGEGDLVPYEPSEADNRG